MFHSCAQGLAKATGTKPPTYDAMITGIDKAPTTRVPGVTAGDTLLARRKYLAGNQNDAEVNEILEEYKTAVKNKRIHLKPVF